MSEYNQILYPTHVFPETHPDTLARMAVLFGMEPPPVGDCRVLEIGCGNGGNIIPMGFEIPNGEFVGIDSAIIPIQNAERLIECSGARNVSVRALDLMEIGPDLGMFDYIIAHGVYSWVPGIVQERILSICRDHLAPRGVAFISFNTGPAGRIRQLTRDMMLFHLQAADINDDPVREGREFLQMLVDLADESNRGKAVLQTEVTRLSKRPDSVTFHDELGPDYSPIYFSDFAAAAERKGLQFLSEADLSDAIEPPGKPEAAEALKRLAKGDVVKYQQYLDFLVFRGFRRTLLCHREIQLERTRFVERVQSLLVASRLRKSSVEQSGEIVFTKRRGPASVTTNNPIVSLALERLETHWPRALHFSELAAEIAEKVAAELKYETPTALAQAVLRLAANKLLDLRTYQPPLAESVGERPLATSLARLQAGEATPIATLLHTQIEIPDARSRRLLQLLDGTRNLPDLVSAMLPEIGTSREATEQHVITALATFHSMGLLRSSLPPI